MRRGLLVLALLAVGLVGFYVAWPAWSAHQIRQALDAGDAAALETRIDFPSVRDSVRPVIAAEVGRSMERLQKEGGSLGAALAGTLNKGLAAQLADAAVNSILTPNNVIRMVKDGTDLRRAINTATGRDIKRASGGGNGRTDPPTPPVETGGAGQPGPAGDAKGPRKLSLANLKSYRITGPNRISVGVVRDPASTQPDVTAEMAFTGGGWKVVGLVPRL